MRYLLDTHVFFWALFQDEKLSAKSRALLQEPESKILVSQVSLLEIAIKYKVGKMAELKVGMLSIIKEIDIAGFQLLPLDVRHIDSYFNATFFYNDHKDPFDRLLISIADAEKTAFITKDEKFDAYKDRVNIIW